MLKAEVDILTKCNHPHMYEPNHARVRSLVRYLARHSHGPPSVTHSVRMHKCYETEKILYLVLELLTGGELFDTIIAKVKACAQTRACSTRFVTSCWDTDCVDVPTLHRSCGGVPQGHYSEADARQVAITLLDSIKYLHEQGVAHRDLKPENILLKDKTDAAAIKITDFGRRPGDASPGCRIGSCIGIA